MLPNWYLNMVPSAVKSSGKDSSTTSMFSGVNRVSICTFRSKFDMYCNMYAIYQILVHKLIFMFR